ncbi:hypothetical protein NDU88_008845 [Pleurodeles waltl]|uniref:Uncharacterized protein n=1 Tax=Pleurodeles waltl TaxID=8319 RepID=A0AAV7QPV7_PLEWA|nr:hypothetical protein NDU88_008845 [Pleurodeles waltl]
MQRRYGPGATQPIVPQGGTVAIMADLCAGFRAIGAQLHTLAECLDHIDECLEHYNTVLDNAEECIAGLEDGTLSKVSGKD